MLANLTKFELSLCTVIAKNALCKVEHHDEERPSSGVGTSANSDISNVVPNNLIDDKRVESELGNLSLKDGIDGCNNGRNILVELAECTIDSLTKVTNCKQKMQESTYLQSSCSFIEMPISAGASGLEGNGMATEGTSEEDSCYQLNSNSWICGDHRNFSSMVSSYNLIILNELERYNFTSLSWGGKTVGRREVKACLNVHSRDKQRESKNSSGCVVTSGLRFMMCSGLMMAKSNTFPNFFMHVPYGMCAHQEIFAIATNKELINLVVCILQARRAFRALGVLVRLKSLVDGPTTKRETVNALKCKKRLSQL
ncbi:hypothetical protein CQW23_07244 [Capsicum baccatum]|uniref:Uncharacterized protein n=1 Tax=Capsicum baccatum TaxID=33114 RepID=A0A2G2X5L5_CAPBA|nr:hypothetical protein CQW23_07244 [Capsicum baccatum]